MKPKDATLKDAEVLAAHMRSAGVSNGQLAVRAGCGRAFIGFLRTGRKTSCSQAVAEKIAEGLKVPVEVLFDLRASADSSDNDKRVVA